MGSRAARMGAIRLRAIIRRAKSTFSEALYFTANTAMRCRSTERNSPVLRLMSPGRRTSILRIKEAVPIRMDSPRMVPDQPPSS